MTLAIWRVILAPLTSLLALFMILRSRRMMTYDAAWCRARMLMRPDEMVYLLCRRATVSQASYWVTRVDDL